jgi:hypothetical protein
LATHLKPATKIYNNFLKNAAGSENMAVDGSASATPFYISCPANTEIELHRCLLGILDTKGMQAEEYGDIGSSLSAGLSLKVMSSDGSTVLADLTGGVPIKTNAGWAQVCYDVTLGAFTNTTNAILQARWTFSKGGQPVLLKAGQRLEMIVDDDLTGLLRQTIMVQGYEL